MSARDSNPELPTGDMPATEIYHLTTPAAWAAATVDGAHRLSTRDLWRREELFPHIYGPLGLEAVSRPLSVRRGSDGRFRLPSGM